MYIHILWVQTLRLCRRARDSCNGGLHLLPIHRAERFPQAMFRRLPTWLSCRDLPLPRFRQAKHSLALIFSRPDVDPPLLAQQGQRTCKRSAVHGKAGTQRFLVGLADNGEGGEQAELGDFDSGLAELLVVNAGHKSGDAPKVLTRARESKERVRGMIVVNRHNNKMYIHVLLVCVKSQSATLDTAGGPFGLAASRRTGMVRSNEVEFLICRFVPKETETYIEAASLDKRHPPGTFMTKLHDGLLANRRPGFVLSSCVGTQSFQRVPRRNHRPGGADPADQARPAAGR